LSRFANHRIKWIQAALAELH